MRTIAPAELRERYRQLYLAARHDGEAENNYHHLPIASQNAALITPSAFWADYADRDANQPFHSTPAEAARSFAEMMLALAVLDLPFEAGKHTTTRDGSKLTLKAASPLIAFHREILAALAPAEVTVLVTQNGRSRWGSLHPGGRRAARQVHHRRDAGAGGLRLPRGDHQPDVGEPEARRTGADPARRAASGRRAAHARPEGDGRALPHLGHGLHVLLPAVGSFAHLGVQVAKNEVLLAFAEPTLLHVVDALKEVDRTSWDHICSRAATTKCVSSCASRASAM
ncbi:MAG: hypothetical protein U1E76_20930 [Planctomycetota bacterium]